MPFSHSFTGVTPPARYGTAGAWTRVLIEESADGITFGQIDDQAIPVDATPETPDSINITTEQALLASGLYRLRFVDADGVFSPYTEAVRSPSTYNGGYVPSIEDVAALLHTRTSVNGTYEGTFNEDTYPSRAQVQAMCEIAAADLAVRLPEPLDVERHADARRVAAYDAAATVEASYFTDEDSPVRTLYSAKYLAGVVALGGNVSTSTDTTSTPPTFQQVAVRAGSYLEPTAEL
jgi:hypothetical protein